MENDTVSDTFFLSKVMYKMIPQTEQNQREIDKGNYFRQMN